MGHTSLKAKMLEAFRVRMFFYISIVSVLFLILIIQIINLQLIHGDEYSLKSKINMENNIPIPASRGELYDRNFKIDSNNMVIVSNRPSFNITTIPSKFKEKDDLNRVLKNVSTLAKVPLESFIEEIKSRNPWERIVLVEDVDFDTIIKIASHPTRFPNIDWEDAPVRVYNYGNMFSHVVGYIGSISRDEYHQLKGQGYRHYQKIGKSGIEKQYDETLRGQDGYVRRIVDVRNRTEAEEVGLRPVSGNNIVLTVDFNIQKTTFEAMDGQVGAAIVIKPSTGEVIAMVSKPDFDPNLIISKDNTQFVKDLNADKLRPFLNRNIQSKYPPASTFKLVTAIAALETEKITPSTSYYCSGKYTLQGYQDKDFFCYETHGTLDLQWAIAKSCSVYFYQLGYKIGPTNILKYAEYFGLDQLSGIDLPGEVEGFIPSKKWKLRTFGQPWFDGDTINLSIGQGFLHLTPAGMANFIAGIVNNGLVYKPHMIREIRSPDNNAVIKVVGREKVREIPLSPVSLNTVKQGMRLSVMSGTSGGLRHLKVPVAGKTGTAQTRSKRMEKFSQHAWFVGYGPFNGTPEQSIAVVVIIEYGIAGAVGAVPVAERIFAKLYETGYFQ